MDSSCSWALLSVWSWPDYAAPTACSAAAAVIFIICYRPDPAFAWNGRIQTPHHIKEVAEAINLVSSQDSEETAVHIGCTSFGIRISASKIKHTAGEVSHYALSSQNGLLTPETAGTLSRLILQLKPDSGPYELLQGNQSIFHLVIYPKICNIHPEYDDYVSRL
jgi:hypothetical protein